MFTIQTVYCVQRRKGIASYATKDAETTCTITITPSRESLDTSETCYRPSTELGKCKGSLQNVMGRQETYWRPCLA